MLPRCPRLAPLGLQTKPLGLRPHTAGAEITADKATSRLHGRLFFAGQMPTPLYFEALDQVSFQKCLKYLIKKKIKDFQKIF